MNVEIKYRFKDESNKSKEGVLTPMEMICAILDKEGEDISSIDLYKAKIGD